MISLCPMSLLMALLMAEGRLPSWAKLILLLPMLSSSSSVADGGLSHLLTFVDTGRGVGFWSGWNNVSVAIAVTAMAGVALAATLVYSSRRGNLKSPWSRRRRKHALSPQLWKSLFTADGRIVDEVKFFKKIRSGGVDPRIRGEVWPFLLGMYDLNSTEAKRSDIRTQKRNEYGSLRRQCQLMLNEANDEAKEAKDVSDNQNIDPLSSEDLVCARELLSREVTLEEKEDEVSVEQHEERDGNEEPDDENEKLEASDSKSSQAKNEGQVEEKDEDKSGLTVDVSGLETDSPDSESSVNETLCPSETILESNKFSKDSLKDEDHKTCSSENFATWKRIIRLDALRANAEWVLFSSSQAAVSEAQARQAALAIELEDYGHLEPCRIYHAARLVAILEGYAIYDPEIGYCQGMSDLLSPIVAVMEEDDEAFWCFVGFMKRARHNFRLDEIGIRRQLSTVSKIIKIKDSHLYKHLEMLQAEDCFFVYRMVVVLFRRELTFEQTLCLWEVMWADQAAIRAGIEKSAWGRIRQHAPPTEDLLLYAIAACVLRRRKLIIEKYNSMDEILRECNSMAGQLDVWELLDDAHDLVVTLHDKM